MERPPTKDFGKRRPALVPTVASQPVKRSRHVALLLTGALAIGGGAYALMPRDNCEPKGAGMAAPSLSQAGTECPPRGSSYGGHGGSGGSWSRSSFFGGDLSSNRSSTGTSGESGSGEVTRGGFGGFARAFAAHFSGGG
jgi:hypothetical protein